MKIVIEKPALKVLRKIQSKVRKAILENIKEIASAPYSSHRNVTALKGTAASFRLRHGDWRVFYRVDQGQLVLVVENVKQRGVAYR